MGLLTNSLDSSPKSSGTLFTMGIPLLAVGYYRYLKNQTRKETRNVLDYIFFDGSIELSVGFFFISVALTLIILEFYHRWKMQRLKGKKGYELHLHKLRIKNMSPDQILKELEKALSADTASASMKSSNKNSNLNSNPNSKNEMTNSEALCYLDKLSTQYCKKKHQEKQTKKGDGNKNKHVDSIELDVICLKAAYLVLKNNHLTTNGEEKYEHDLLICEALSLLALIAKNTKIRQLHMESADEFGFDAPINAVRNSLLCAQKRIPYILTQDKDGNHPASEDGNAIEGDEKERIEAELQRKACLFLGAVADGDIDIATTVVNESGLQIILNALNWFRFHEGVGNWGLWAIFILCYEHSRNKGKLVNMGGVNIICQTMRHNPDCVEVQRHGTAILFDLMRGGDANESRSLNSIIEIRTLALNAGLHEVVHQAMTRHKSSMEVMMMGREMLIASQFRGDIPSCDGALVRT